jgi:hypothetical protein
MELLHGGITRRDGKPTLVVLLCLHGGIRSGGLHGDDTGLHGGIRSGGLLVVLLRLHGRIARRQRRDEETERRGMALQNGVRNGVRGGAIGCWN